jgi:hypothetical protein
MRKVLVLLVTLALLAGCAPCTCPEVVTPVGPTPTPDPVALLGVEAQSIVDCLHARGGDARARVVGKSPSSTAAQDDIVSAEQLESAGARIDVQVTDSLVSPYTGVIVITASDPSVLFTVDLVFQGGKWVVTGGKVGGLDYITKALAYECEPWW